MKYKFRLSYKLDNQYVAIKLDEVEFLNSDMKTNIETIDEFTTKFESYDEMLNYLKNKKLIPDNVERLYVTFDVKKDNKIYQQLYAYNKTLFFKSDKDKLKYSYVYRYFRDKFSDGIFMERIVEHYERKYVYKNFNALKLLARSIKENSIWSLDSYDKSVYYDEFNSFLDFIFQKKTKQGKKVNYKNVRDFICFVNGEEPIKVKGNEVLEKTFTKDKELIMDEYIDPDNITLEEYYNSNKNLINDSILFEAYQDGIDYIKPLSQEEINETFSDYAKKYSLKRDNGEYV